MATKGTYAGYVAPELPSGQFAAADSFAQMAQRTAQKRAEERAEQRQLRAEARQAMYNAVQAGNIDMTKINNSVHGMVSKIADSYGEKLVDMMEDLDENYSYSKQLEISRAQAEFQQKIQKLTSIGGTIETLSKGIREKSYDPMLSSKGVNGLYNFINRIPELSENIDPETLEINGKDITQIFSEQVPMAEFVPFVDLSSSVDDYLTRVLNRAKKKTVTEIDGSIKRTIKEYNFSDREARSVYDRQFKGSLEDKKLKHSILMIYDRIEDPEQKADFEQNYVRLDEDGEPFVTDDGAYNYIYDSYLEEKRRQIISEEEIEEETPKTSGGFTPQDAKANLVSIDQFFNAGGSTNLKEIKFNIGGKTADVESGKRIYDWKEGKPKVRLWYASDTSNGRRIFGKRDYEPTVEGRQALANQLFDGELDYLRTAQEIGHEPTYEPMTFADRDESISEEVDRVTDNLSISYIEAPLSVPEDQRKMTGNKPHEYGIDGVLMQLNEMGISNTAIENIVKDKMSVDADDEKWGFMSSESFAESPVTRDKALETIALGAMAATSMKKEGMSDEDVRKNVEELMLKHFHSEGNGYAAFESLYSLDKVKRYIRNNNLDEASAMQMVNSFIASKARQGENVTDEEILEQLRRSRGSEKNKKIQWAEINGADIDWDAAADDLGISVEEAKIKYYKEHNK